MNGRTDGQKVSLFYRSVSPIGAAVCFSLRKPKVNSLQTQVEQGRGTAGHLMPLGLLLNQKDDNISLPEVLDRASKMRSLGSYLHIVSQMIRSTSIHFPELIEPINGIYHN